MKRIIKTLIFAIAMLYSSIGNSQNLVKTHIETGDIEGIVE